MTSALATRLRGAPLVLFDGTMWCDDEMLVGGTGHKTGARMGHMAMDGPEGSIAGFEGLEVERKVFVHINNTNPVLDPDSPERRAAEAAGWMTGRMGWSSGCEGRCEGPGPARGFRGAPARHRRRAVPRQDPPQDRLHGGRCTPDEVRAWVISRWYYQSRIPMKDAAFMSRVEDPGLRRAWRKRIQDHDGTDMREGGMARWLRLARAVGLHPDYVASGVGVLPATRFAVDAYVALVRERPLLEAVASSLTELFAPKIHATRIEGLIRHCDFADDDALSYFRARLDEAPVRHRGDVLAEDARPLAGASAQGTEGDPCSPGSRR